MSTYLKDTIETACKYRLKEYNNLHENLSEVKEHINRMFLNQKQIVKDYKVFSKVYYAFLIFDNIYFKALIPENFIQLST